METSRTYRDPASTSPQRGEGRARPRLIALGVLILAIFGTVFAGTKFSDATWAPNLALDLEGGTQIILMPHTADGSQITPDDIQQAIEIIRQRVDASGVAEAEITSQGGQNIVVALPGEPSRDTLDLVRQSAQMRFRSFLFQGNPGPIDPSLVDLGGEGDAEDGEEAEPEGTEEAEGESAAPAPTYTQEEIDRAAFAAADSNGDGVLDDKPAETPVDTSDQNWITEKVMYDFYRLDCTDPASLIGGGGDDPEQPLVACAKDGMSKYVLGPMEIPGTDIATATSGLNYNQAGAPTGDYAINIKFNKEGSDKFRDVTNRLATEHATDGLNRFAAVLDGLVTIAPSVTERIPSGEARITGNFTRDEAANLARQLSFGALPITFEVQSEEQISATLGSEQLEKGLLAGLIGLILVVGYSLWQYRGLAIVTVTSLTVAATLTFGVIALLSWIQGYRLSLPGVAGLIIAIGITADSFIVYFERIRDEVREGRTLSAAVEYGWERARRTILASDTVNLLAAIVLYFLAVGGVRGFAFTLGLTTVIDLIVVFGFTHPIMKILIRTKFYGGGHKLSGLDPEHLGASVARYQGRGSFRSPGEVGHKSIAERKREAMRQQQAMVDAHVEGEN